uniref:Catalase n=1 Tax=Sinocyclocheilus rhinocerous TaxID=307959 RepID=A0A673MT34_9TELE
DKLNLMTAGPRGPLLVQDVVFTDEMAHFDRERIPERVVHAKGAGNTFLVFENLLSLLHLFVTLEHKTSHRSHRYICSNSQQYIVLIFLHPQIPDFQIVVSRPDIVLTNHTSMESVFIQLSDDGASDFHDMSPLMLVLVFQTDQGIKNLPVEEADRLASTDPDYSIRDLYNAISNGNFPSWTLYIQVMTFEQAENWQWNPFDLTKVWPHKDFPLIPVGRLVLNRNPINYFAEVEQLAFDPSNMPPGIEPSPDKMLQGRLFSYPDTHRHRLGANYLQLSVNCPYRTRVANYQRDGPMCMFDNQGGAPNYFPNSFSAPDTQLRFVESKCKVSPDVARYNSADDDNVTQVRTFFTQVLNEAERERLCQNMAGHIKGAQLFIQKRAVQNLMAVHPDYGTRIQTLLDKYNTEGKKNTIHVYTRGGASAVAAASKM